MNGHGYNVQMVPTPYTAKQKKRPKLLSYKIPMSVRARVAYTLADLLSKRGLDMRIVFHDASVAALSQYGYLDRPEVSYSHIDGSDHFSVCEDGKALDFIQWMFQSPAYKLGQMGVDAVNDIFREEGIGYEFSPYVATEVPVDPPSYGKPMYGPGGGYRVEIQYPEATKKSNEWLHANTSMPALRLLSSAPIWKVANEEMLKAHEHFRRGDFPDAIHWAGKCLESVLQIICDKNGWSFVPDKSTLNPLLQACYKGGLFAAPYIDVIQKSSGEIRNAWSGHGKAKSAHGKATQAMAEHMLQITSAHVMLLAKMAGF